MNHFLPFIKYLLFEICSVYTFLRSLNLRSERKPVSLFWRSAVCALLPALAVSLTDSSWPELTPLLLTGISVFACSLLFRKEIQLTIIAVTLSHGLAYCIRLLAVIPFGFLLARMHLNSERIIFQFLVFCLQFPLHVFLLHFRRFRHGFPFLDDPQYYETGASACLVILFAITLTQSSSMQTESGRHLFLGIALLLMLSVPTVVHWLLKTMRRKYRDQLQQTENEYRQKELDRLSAELKKVKADNERLSSLIHRDNKLLPALLLSVREFLYRACDEADPEKRREAAEKITAELETVAAERGRALENYEFAGQPLPKTGIPRIDTMLSYMNQRAFNSKISFQMNCAADFMTTVFRSLSEEDLSTLIADLTENALIATRDCEKRHILLWLDMRKGQAVVAVYDSGIPFPPEVRAAWGVKRLTTHADTGGSGIGMMQTWELCRKSGASFQIEDYPPEMPYTKCVSVTFP